MSWEEIQKDNAFTRLSEILDGAADTAIGFVQVYFFGLLAIGFGISAVLGLIRTGRANMVQVMIAIVCGGIAISQGIFGS